MTLLDTRQMSIGEALETLLRDRCRCASRRTTAAHRRTGQRVTSLRLQNERGLAYLLTAPGDLGLARAYVSGDLQMVGRAPRGPRHPSPTCRWGSLRLHAPGPRAGVRRCCAPSGSANLRPPAPPPQEPLPRWRRRAVRGCATPSRDAEAISHHYDVSNRFYELVLGPSMTYTCAVYPTPRRPSSRPRPRSTTWSAASSTSQPGQRLLDVGCGWGGMVRHAAHTASRARRDAVARSRPSGRRRRSSGRARRPGRGRHLDYRDVDRVRLRRDQLDRPHRAHRACGTTRRTSATCGTGSPGGRLLNHCITRPTTTSGDGAFIDRYVFPDGELPGRADHHRGPGRRASRCGTRRTSAATTP